jgi:hypothetical protein
MFLEMQTRLDNMSVMAMEMCRAMGMDMTFFLQTLDVESEGISDVGEGV